MSSTSRPSLASVMLIAAAMVWCFLIAVILMLWCVGTHFVGNPLLHFGGWVALALTGLGHRQRLADRLAAGFQPKHPILLPATDATVEFHRPRVYRATAPVPPDAIDRYDEGFVDGLAKRPGVSATVLKMEQRKS